MPASFFLRCCPLFSIAALSACGFEHRFGSSSNHAYEDHNTRGYEVPDLPADAGVTDPPSACDAIDRFKELLVIDRSVLQSDAAQNEIAGAAFSFRSVLERLADRPDDAARLFADWLDAWGAGDAIATPHASPPRARLRELLLDPWRRLGSAGLGPVARVPLRLIAIVNRVDLRDGVCGACGYRGELRLVYTGVDVTTGEALAMTLSVEVPYPRSRSARA